MKILLRAAFLVLSLTAGVPAVAGVANTDNTSAPTQQDTAASWANG